MFVKIKTGTGGSIYSDVRVRVTETKTGFEISEAKVFDTVNEHDLISQMVGSFPETISKEQLSDQLIHGYDISPEYSQDLAQQVLIELSKRQKNKIIQRT